MNKLTKTIYPILIVAVLALIPTSSFAYGYKNILSGAEHFGKEVQSTNSFEVSAKGKMEVAFSPDEGGEYLVTKVINSAQKEILVLSYSFTSAPVTEALIKATRRGVAVRIVSDYKSNVSEDRSGKAQSALSALKNAGADVRTISVYPIHHDKVIIVDRQTVELGSFNYSSAAAHRNSENVLVNWNNPDLAMVYEKHFERNYKQSDVYNTRY